MTTRVLGHGVPKMAAAALIGMMTASPAVPQVSSLEYRVKAAYLLNFARYVEWPAESFASESEPLSVCIAGNDPFGALLDQTFEGHVVSGRAVVGRRIPSPDQAAGCHIVFIAAEGHAPGPGPTDLPGRAVLTVGENSSFLSAGGMVRFLLVEDTVRFEVNMVAAQRAGLKISSRMLSFAWAVRPEG